jgi:hypothetical protein
MTQNANRILTDAQLRVTACEEQAHLKTIHFLARVFAQQAVATVAHSKIQNIILSSSYPEFFPLPWPTAGGGPKKASAHRLDGHCG